MSDREPTRWQHNRIYPNPISPPVYTYDSDLYCRETVDTHCSNIKSQRNNCCKSYIINRLYKSFVSYINHIN